MERSETLSANLRIRARAVYQTPFNERQLYSGVFL